MSLIVDSSRSIFDTAEVEKGYLLYAEHRSWSEGRAGIVTAVTEDRLTVQFHPAIGNVMNHFFIPASEVADGQWHIRWSKDMDEIGEVTMAEDGDGT